MIHTYQMSWEHYVKEVTEGLWKGSTIKACEHLNESQSQSVSIYKQKMRKKNQNIAEEKYVKKLWWLLVPERLEIPGYVSDSFLWSSDLHSGI